MTCRALLTSVLLSLPLVAGVARAEDADEAPEEVVAQDEADAEEEEAEEEDGSGIHWSATLQAALHKIASREAHDDVTGFFDQYEYIPNKGSDLPIELGVSDAAFDWFGAGETPLLQFRLESPTSNLGLGITDIDHSFLNQRADLLGGHRGVSFDLDYRRMRTESLRIFPNNAGSGLTFTDQAGSNDRFFEERTGFDGALRFRPGQAFTGLPESVTWLSPELEMRGGYQVRDGQRQLRFLLAPGNDWLSRDQSLDQEVGDVGGGVLVAPGGLFTLRLDVDYEQFRENSSALLESDLGAPFPSNSNVIDFVPDTDRVTGTVRAQSRIGERAQIHGGFQFAQLEQVPRRTPDQRTAELDDNRVLFYSANLAGDLQIVDGVSANAFFKLDDRNNDIQRDTPLFNPDGGTQVDEFLDHLRRIQAGSELVYHFYRTNLVALGARAEWVKRDLDFVPFDPDDIDRRILPATALMSDETEMYTFYARTGLRPLRGLTLRSELGYREAPETGYLVDLDNYFYGKFDASYVVPIETSLVLSAFARGGTGENHEFNQVGGLGPDPPGPSEDRDFERSDFLWGVTATTSPWERSTVFATFFQSRDAQDYHLVLSNLQRYFQDAVPLAFTSDGPVDYRADDFGVIFGTQVGIGERNDAGLSYAFNRTKTRYRTSGSTSGAIEQIEDASRIDADIHRIGVTLGRRLLDGLRVSAGYRFDLYDDHAPVDGAIGSQAPFDLDTFQHTVTLGVTLTSDLFE